MCSASNNYGGDHNHKALQELMTDVLVEVLKHCPNAKTFFWGKSPTNTLLTVFFKRLQKEGLTDIFLEEF